MQERHSSQDVGSLNMAFNDLQISTERAIFERFCITAKDVKDLSTNLLSDLSNLLSLPAVTEIYPSFIPAVFFYLDLESHSHISVNSKFLNTLHKIKDRISKEFDFSTCTQTLQNPIYAISIAVLDATLLALKKVTPQQQQSPCELWRILFCTIIAFKTEFSKEAQAFMYAGILMQKTWNDVYPDNSAINANFLFSAGQICKELKGNMGEKFKEIPYQDEQLQKRCFNNARSLS